MRTFLMIVAIVLAAVTVQDASYAQSPRSADRSIAIKVSELDLQSADGMTKAYDRLSRASQRVCREDGLRGIERRKMEQACTMQTLDNAVAALGSPTMAAMHRNGTGRTTAVAALDDAASSLLDLTQPVVMQASLPTQLVVRRAS